MKRLEPVVDFILDHVGVIAIFLGAALFIGGPIWYVVACYHHVQHFTCTVEDKDRTSNSKGVSDMRIYTTDCGNLTVADAMFRSNYHSSDTFAAIKPGHRYEFTTIGFRIPFMSEFPNIVEAKEVTP